MTSLALIDRLRAKSIVDSNGCWLWQGFTMPDSGYPRMAAGAEQFAHRVAYIALHGAIPAGLTIDHACHTRDIACTGGPSCMHRRCVNPHHMEAVTCRTNVLRSPNSIAGINSRRTECKWGHPFDAENTLIEVAKNGQIWRRCRKCAKRRNQESQQRRLMETVIEDAA